MINHRKRQGKRRYTFLPKNMVVLLVVFTITSTIGYAQDPRVPADSHPLAPAVGRLSNGCTAWISQGGVLITAGHCERSNLPSQVREITSLRS